MIMENLKMKALYLKDVAIVILKRDGSRYCSVDDEEWPFPLASKFFHGQVA